MRRVFAFIFRNWPLKLGAIVLASLLYAGLVLSQGSSEFTGSIPIQGVGQASDVYLLSDLGSVRTVRFYASENLGTRVDSASFKATVDLSDVDPAAGSTSVAVRVVAVDPRIQVQAYEPSRINVRVDKVVTSTVPVRAVLGTVPAGLELGTPVLSVDQATVRGPASVIRNVSEVQALVPIDPSGIDVNRTVDLQPVNALGEPVSPVDVEPTNVQVRVPVFTNRQTRSVPVHPVVTGTPAAGFEIGAVTVDPLVVAVEGDANDLSGLDLADTKPVTISGASSNVTQIVGLSLPSGVQSVGGVSVRVTVQLHPVTATRTYEAGLILVGARSDRTYTLSTDRVLVTIAGSVADLDRLSGSPLTVTLDVSGLDIGAHPVKVTANLLTGLTLVGSSPGTVTVTIGPGATSAPVVSPSPGP